MQEQKDNVHTSTWCHFPNQQWASNVF